MTEIRTVAQDARAGAARMAPLIVAVIPIGLVFGAVAATKGLSPLEAALMSALVFAGGSQFVAMDIWTHPASWTAVGFAALLVNIRHLLMSASILPKMARFRPVQKLASLSLLADEIWAMAEFRGREGSLTPAWFFGAALPFYLVWIASGLAGALLGAFVGGPAVVGLDFAFPAVFIVLLMGFWKGPETGLVLIASAVSALTVHHFVPGVWYIAAGALGGLAAAAFSRGGRAEAEVTQ